MHIALKAVKECLIDKGVQVDRVVFSIVDHENMDLHRAFLLANFSVGLPEW